MLRIRDIHGKTEEVSPAKPFVEICSADGLVAAVFIADKDGSVIHLTPGSPEASNYAKRFNVKWTKIYSK